MIAIVAEISWLGNQLPNCKETANRKKILQTKASLDKNKSQRIKDLRLIFRLRLR
jgi:hypothetical protein